MQSPGRKSKSAGPELNETAFMLRICDILNFARMRLVKIIEMGFTPDTPIRTAIADYPADAFQGWSPWSMNIGRSASRPESNLPMISNDRLRKRHVSKWIIDGLASDYHFEDIFVELSDEFIIINQYLRRDRFASRILADIAEIYIARGDYEAAIPHLLKSIDNCSIDPWNKLLSWRVFRLACCQRRQSDAPEYLKTLTYCLGTRLAHTVPMKLRHHLQQDLEAVVNEKEVSDFRWTLTPLFGMKIDIQDTAGGKSIQPLMKTNVRMHTCEIGDQVQADVVLKSNLATAIQVDSVKIFLQNIDDFQRFAEANDEVIESDAAFVLMGATSITIEPGDNVFSFPWPAMSVGEYVISSVCMQWHKAAFYQDFTATSSDVLGFDVLPNEPTQSIELNPIFLIPGHVQNVRLLFHSGSDVVNGGKVKLVCSQGLQVISPDGRSENENQDWQDSCEFDLGSCLPDSTITMIASVKSEAIDSYNPNDPDQKEDDHSYSCLQTLEATVTTSYHHGVYKTHAEENLKIDSPPITAILEASVTTLELAALTIKSSGAWSIGDDRFVIGATVRCNTPVPFYVKKWDITLPSSLSLDENGDMNDHLIDCTVIEGEELYFGFGCKTLGASKEESEKNDGILEIILEDGYGKSFVQVLPLDLHAFYKHIDAEKQAGEALIVANAQLTSTSQQGLVGTPVSFTYTVDFRHRQYDDSSPLHIAFHLSCVDEYWIIGGSVRGVINSESSSSLTFVGIPVKAGVIQSFPIIELAISQETKASRIKVIQKHPTQFIALAHTTVDEIACASTLVEV